MVSRLARGRSRGRSRQRSAGLTQEPDSCGGHRSEVPGAVHGLHGHDGRRRLLQTQVAHCISTRAPGRPARGISSRGMGRPARVAMNPSVPARPWSRGVIQKTIASPGARFLDSDVKLVGAAGGSRSSGPSVTVKNGALARFCSRLYTNRLGKMRSWNRSPWWVHSDPESSKTSNPWSAPRRGRRERPG